jgi:hypothetical protein
MFVPENHFAGELFFAVSVAFSTSMNFAIAAILHQATLLARQSTRMVRVKRKRCLCSRIYGIPQCDNVDQFRATK